MEWAVANEGCAALSAASCERGIILDKSCHDASMCNKAHLHCEHYMRLCVPSASFLGVWRAEKALRRAAASESCLYDDAGSITSNTTTMSLSEWGMEDSDLNPVDAAIELIQEKRCA